MFRFWSKPSRVLLGAAALLMLKPGTVTDVAGAALIIAALVLETTFSKMKKRKWNKYEKSDRFILTIICRPSFTRKSTSWAERPT